MVGRDALLQDSSVREWHWGVILTVQMRSEVQSLKFRNSAPDSIEVINVNDHARQFSSEQTVGFFMVLLFKSVCFCFFFFLFFFVSLVIYFACVVY